MELTTRDNFAKSYSLAMVKSFLIWTFTLGVCLLVVGFPLIVLMVTIGSLLAIALQSILPVSAVLLVAGSLISINVLAVVLGAAVLTFNGVHPEEVRWLNWLHGEADALHTSVYAACPLTCELHIN
jgi:CHASE2 domain-containing sensor protein